MSEQVKFGPDAAWKAALQELELQMTKATFNTWMNGSKLLRVEPNGVGLIYHVGVRNDYAKDWLENRLRDTIERTLTAVSGETSKLKFSVMPEPPSEPPPPPMLPFEEEEWGGDEGMEPNEIPSQPQKKAGRPTKLPYKKNDSPKDEVTIDVDESPLYGFVKTPHYAKRFWQPYLGLVPFSLWGMLLSYFYFVKRHNGEWPTIALLVDSMGQGDRATLLGRAARVDKNTGVIKRPSQDGAIAILVKEGVLEHHIDGEGRQAQHSFRRVQSVLPILTPAQVAKLPPAKQLEHEVFLSYYPSFDYQAWQQIRYYSELVDGPRRKKSL